MYGHIDLSPFCTGKVTGKEDFEVAVITSDIFQSWEAVCTNSSNVGVLAQLVRTGSFQLFFPVSLLYLHSQLFGLWCYKVVIVKHQSGIKISTFKMNNLIWTGSRICFLYIVIITVYCYENRFGFFGRNFWKLCTKMCNEVFCLKCQLGIKIRVVPAKLYLLMISFGDVPSL